MQTSDLTKFSVVPASQPAVASSEDEERLARMTLLVGLVGRDGIVLAADTILLEPRLNSDDIDERIDGRKIVCLEKHGIAYAAAGDRLAQSVGKELEKDLDDKKFKFDAICGCLASIANRTITEEFNRTAQITFADRKLLVVFCGNQVSESQLWRVDIKASNGSEADPIYGRETAGARGNAARFFQCYFEPNLPVKNLKSLAAQIILAGHSWSPDIDGLDMLVASKHLGLKWLDEEEKSALRKRFRKLDDTIRKSLLS
jgi:20S proteasome alpha/beta subunit